VETLIPLLKSNNEDIVKLAIWIASEIAIHACDLFPYVIQYVKSSDAYIRYHSLVFIMLCSTTKHKEAFIHIVQSITDDNIKLGMMAMRLLSNADVNQLLTATELVAKYQLDSYELHQTGLLNLLNVKEIDEALILNMLRDHQSLVQQYGAMLIKRKGGDNTKLINEALASNNPVVREFALAL
jgi:hypothetical protein